MTVFISLACCAAYYGLGLWLVARPSVTRNVAHNITRFSIIARDPGQVEEWRRQAAFFGALIAFAWPAFLIVDRLADSAPRSRPEADLLLEQRERRIAELERELEIRS